LGQDEPSGMGFLEGDEPASEHQEGEVVLGLLGPANQQSTVAVEPGVTRFDHPAVRLPVGVTGLKIDLLAAASDVRCEVVVVDERA
jgi:hypothetical protein